MGRTGHSLHRKIGLGMIHRIWRSFRVCLQRRLSAKSFYLHKSDCVQNLQRQTKFAVLPLLPGRSNSSFRFDENRDLEEANQRYIAVERYMFVVGFMAGAAFHLHKI